MAPCADSAIICPVFYFVRIEVPELDLGVILLFGLFINILKFTNHVKKSDLNQVLIVDHLASNSDLTRVNERLTTILLS